LQQIGAIPGTGPAYAGHPAASQAQKTAPRRHLRRRRPRSRRWLRFTLLTALAALIGGAAVIVGPSLVAAIAATDGYSRVDQALAAAGFGIDEVTVSGHRYTTDSDIFDALDLPNVPTMAALHSAQVQARLRRLPWIATANLTRVYPGRIAVTVTERSPFAAWTNDGKTMLIDATGRELSPVRETDWPALPRISGTGAPEHAASLFQMLGHFPQLASRLRMAERISARRWQLHLTDGVRLDLPSEGEATALANLLASKAAARYLGEPGTLIDVRSPTRFAARMAAPVARPPAGGP